MNEEYENIIKAVASAADLTSAQVLSNRRFAEVKDARWIAVKVLHDTGVYPSRISAIMGMSVRHVNTILYQIEVKLSQNDRFLCQILAKTRKKLGQNSEISI